MRLLVISCLLALLTAASTVAALPEKLRVLSLELNGGVALRTTAGELSSAATQLRDLLQKADPDLICVQGAADWENCSQVADLKPGYRVLICSAFPQTVSTRGRGQVALIARERAILSWVEQISGEQGFAFALLQAGTRKIGVFSVQDDRSIPVADRIAIEVRKLRDFAQNRPDSFLIAGGVSAPSLAQAGFLAAPASSAGSPVLQFQAAGAGFLSQSRQVVLPAFNSPVSLCDLDTANPDAGKFAYQPLLFAGETLAAAQEQIRKSPLRDKPFSPWWPASLVLVLLLGLAFLIRKGSASRSVAIVPSPSRLPLGSEPEAVRAGLITWLKSQFVQRLLSQRSELLHAEAEAARRTLAIEERLTQLQANLQERISGYENRIQRLENELSASTIENRELIRTQIELLREKLAKAREEHSLRRN